MAVNAQYLFPNDLVTPLGKFRHVFNSVTAYTFDYSRWLNAGETIASVAYSVFPATTPALAVADSVIASPNKKVTYNLSGGLERTEYQVQVLATTSTGQVKADTILITVPSYLVQDSGAVPQIPPGSADLVADLLEAATAAATYAAAALADAGDAATSATLAGQAKDDAEAAVVGVPAQLAAKANIASPTFTGVPAAPTPAADDDSTKIATTAFVQGELTAGLAAKAPLASPTFTGTPAAPTPTADDSTTKIATTAYVQGELQALAADDLTSGIIPDARMPNLTGDVTTVEGAVDTTIADEAVTLVKMAALAANSILGNNTGAPVTPIALTVAQVKELLQIDRAAAIDTSTGTEHDFLDIPPWVRRITVMLKGVSLSGTNSILIQLGDAGGIEATGYDSVAVLDINATPIVAVAATNGILLQVAVAAAAVSAVFTLVNITGNVWLAEGKYMYDGAGDGVIHIFATKTLGLTLDRIRLTRTGADNFDAGTFNILYE